MASKDLSLFSVILGIVTFLMAPEMAAQGAVLYASNATAFNLFLASWLDVFMYVLTVIFLALGLSTLFN